MKKKNLIWLFIVPTLLVVLNIVIKGIFLGSNSVAGDEPFSIYVAQMDPVSSIKYLLTGNNPPLYELILHFWIQIFGISAFSVRFPSLIFSAVTVFFIYRLALKHINQRVALYASLIFIFSNYHILFAHESRVYALLGMLSVMSMYYFLNLILESNKSQKRNYIFYIIVSTLLIYSHYFGFFILISQVIFLILNSFFLIEKWKHILLSIGLLVLLYIPNIVVLVIRLIDSTSNGTWLQPPNGIEAIYSMLRAFSNAPVVTVFVIVILISAIIKYFLTKKKLQSKSQSTTLIVIWFTFIFLFMFIVSFKAPMFLDRYLMPSAVAFPLLIAVASDFLIKKRNMSFIIPGVICLLFTVTAKPNMSNKRNAKEAIEKVISLKDDSTMVYICPSRYEINFTYYYNRLCFENYNNKAIKANFYECLNADNIYPIDSHNQMSADMMNQFDHIVFLDAGAGFAFPDNGILNKLNKTFQLKAQFEFYQIFKVYDFIKK